MSCFMVINGICSTNMCARQLSFNFSFMVWGAWPRAPPPWIRPCTVDRSLGTATKMIGNRNATSNNIVLLSGESEWLLIGTSRRELRETPPALYGRSQGWILGLTIGKVG